MSLKGYLAAGVACGIKQSGAPDLALIVSERPAKAAGVFTTNRVKAAPVRWSKRIVETGNPVHAVVINSGNANAVTGVQGMRDAEAMATLTAQAIGCQPENVLVMSTGVIGVPMPMEKVAAGISQAAESLRSSGWGDAAKAIMTTDTHSKGVVRQQGAWNLQGIAKGAGMIAPNMATMLGLLVTDAKPLDLAADLRAAADVSFNRIVVDGDMSTNDTVLLLANGAAGIAPGDPFGWTLADACTELAKAIVKDGEGATKLVAIQVEGAPSAADAEAVARAIATSPLCKTAFTGADPNWGRFLAAAGRSGADFDPSHVSVWVGDVNLLLDGEPVDFSDEGAVAVMRRDEWTLTLHLGSGKFSCLMWTCDLSHDYITINADYRT